MWPVALCHLYLYSVGNIGRHRCTMECAGEYFLLACLGDKWPHQRFRLVWWEPMWTAIRKISIGLSGGGYFADDQYLTLSIETDTRVAIWVSELWASLVALPEQTVDSLCSIIKVLSPKSLGLCGPLPFFFFLSCVDLIDNLIWFCANGSGQIGTNHHQCFVGDGLLFWGFQFIHHQIFQ